jgi:hypothetical protein
MRIVRLTTSTTLSVCMALIGLWFFYFIITQGAIYTAKALDTRNKVGITDCLSRGGEPRTYKGNGFYVGCRT